MDLIAEEPAPRSGGRRHGNEIGQWLDEVRRFPGKSFRYPKPVYPSMVTSIKKGNGYGTKPGEFTAITRRQNQEGTTAQEVAMKDGVSESAAANYVWVYVIAHEAA